MSIARKFIALGLLILVAFPLICYLLFYIQEQSIHAEIKKAFKQKELSTIRVTKLKWYEEDKEIIVNGKLFDVSSVAPQPDGSYIVKGLFDHQEQALYALLDKTTEESQHSPLLVEYAACFISDHLNFSQFTIIKTYTNRNTYSGYLETMVSQFHPGIIVPPPRHFLFHS